MRLYDNWSWAWMAAVRALAHADQFQPGTNFKAWITTILRNSYFNVVRQRSRVAPMTAVRIGVPLTVGSTVACGSG